MLVIISDLHLTDGTSGETIDEKAFRVFRNRLSDMAYDASWRLDDQKKSYYKPVEQIDILLLGDIIDMIRSEQWNHAISAILPWTDNRGDDFYANIKTISDGVLKRNEKSFSILKGFSEGDIKIPAMMTEVSDAEKLAENVGYHASAEKVAPKVNIYYMVGNHDWFLYIDDPRMHPIRNDIIDALGLANERDKPFPYYPFENEGLFDAQQAHRLYAIHGDEFDETNCQDSGRDGSSVGDVVVIRLLNEIPNQIEKQIRKFPQGRVGTEEDIQEFVKELREIDNLRPYSLAPDWISQVLEEYELDPHFINDSIRDALREMITNFVDTPLIAKNKSIDIVMRIARFFLGKHFSISDLASIINHFSLSKDDFESYKEFANKLANEDVGRDKDFFVMGHTHYPEIVPLSSYMEDGNKRGKIYFNSGTWRALHKRGVYDNSFISYKTMTIVAFYKPDERGARSFEFWTGSLA
ncbi:hypothetical protein [Taibaiella soli]|uniref:Calcineurin-like phosphoesterase domain-containing protein n=1 Tax=Taibaiella soli TaxID=1649169 RepID=A0A2W2BFW2_9BACT|nr:hypothetical protein [Taibaiella soli]PZF74787.1 hypothetical protein DN068_00905 [Taibaiella soli]